MADGTAPPGGFTYWVSDEQLAVFASQTPERRLRWLDETRELMIRLAPADAKARWSRLRQGG